MQPQQPETECRRRIWDELQTRDNRIRTCLVLLTVIGVPAFMIWWQVTASPLRDAWSEEDGGEVKNDNIKAVADIISSSKENSDGFDVASDVDGVSNSMSSTSPSRPKMIWLMSFPNSGTSYTMRLTASASQRAIASNYGPEFTNDKHPVNYPLYPPSVENEDKEEASGPFWRGSPDDENYRPLPDKLIITKTHCGGRCVRCSPEKYVLTLPQFLRACTQGEGCFAEGNNGTRCENRETHYPPPPNNPHLAKMIHLVRNPFDNIVSRYHLARKLWQARLKDKPHELQKWLDLHPNNATGFVRWCDEMDTTYGSPFAARKTDIGNNDYHHQMVSAVDLTCQGEWFRYIQWHTLALDTLELSSDLPSLTIYYEDYSGDWNATVEKILDFLEVPRPLENQTAVREFISRPPYDEYYTHDHRKQARNLVKKLSSDKLWKLLRRYF